MALIEKALADDLVDLRQQQALGTEYVPIGDLIAAKQAHLEREQWWRAQMGRMAENGRGRGVTDDPYDHITRLFTNPPWMADAPCKGKTADFFGQRGSTKTAERAIAICDTCPHQRECLQYALDNGEVHGTWGGLTAEQRKDLRNGRGTHVMRRPVQRELPPIAHGTHNGYRQEMRRKIPVCDACRQARNEWRNARRHEFGRDAA
jgi:WhiB family transcriptional regulator, redox-sensing transcriptional regulator